MPADGVRYICGDAKDDSFIDTTLNEIKPDAIVDFMNYGSAAFAARRDCLLSSTGQYVFTSSCRVFAGEDVHTERSPRLLDVCKDPAYLATDEYALAKARSENALRDSGRTNWTIVRPCIAYSFPRLQFGCLEAPSFLYRAMHGVPVAAPDAMLEKKTSMIWAGDVAEMMARLVLNPSAMCEDFNAVTAESHTWGEIAGIYGELVGLKTKDCPPERYEQLCSHWQLWYGRMVHHAFDNAKILAATGLRQEDLRTLPDGLVRELARFQNEPDAVRFDLTRNALQDRFLHVRTIPPRGTDCRTYWSLRHPWIVGGLPFRAARKIWRMIRR